MILKNRPSVLVRKESLSPSKKARWQISQHEFVKDSGIPDRVLDKYIVARIVREPGLDLLYPYKMD